MPNATYEEMVEREKSFYNGERPASSIPSFFTYWACKFLSPKVVNMFGTNSIEEFYSLEIQRVLAGRRAATVLSLGSGEGSSEIIILKSLLATGVDARMICTDISESMSDAGSKNAEAAGVKDRMSFETLDINKRFPACNAQFVIANHSLHHFVGLEFIFDSAKRQIGSDGAFIVSDMIGRNGHMRWPEVLGFTKAFWGLLPLRQRIDLIHQRQRTEFVDWDCADGTFEGVRAQDILPLCVGTFHFERFLGFGGIPDTFVDRMYGGNFSPDNIRDCNFIDAIEILNETLLINGKIKPTSMLATMRSQRGSENTKYWPTNPVLAVRAP